jgi:hypothetical protein
VVYSVPKGDPRLIMCARSLVCLPLQRSCLTLLGVSALNG